MTLISSLERVFPNAAESTVPGLLGVGHDLSLHQQHQCCGSERWLWPAATFLIASACSSPAEFIEASSSALGSGQAILDDLVLPPLGPRFLVAAQMVRLGWADAWLPDFSVRAFPPLYR